jgi:hypothetical protein
VIEFEYQAQSWNKPRRVVCKIEWQTGELFPRVGFIVTNSNLEAEQVITIYNGRAEIENRIKEGKNTLRWDKTNLAERGVCSQSSKASRRMSCLQSAPHDSGCGIPGESVKPSIDSVIWRLVKVGGALSWQEVVRPCCVSFFPRPLLSHLIHLSLPHTKRGGKRAINCGDGGMSSNCPHWSDRHFFLRVLIGISSDLRTFGILM